MQNCYHNIDISRLSIRLCVMVYVADSLRRTADVQGGRHFRSSNKTTLTVSPSQRSTLDDRAVPVAASHEWNSLSKNPFGLRRRHWRIYQGTTAYETKYLSMLSASDNLYRYSISATSVGVQQMSKKKFRAR